MNNFDGINKTVPGSSHLKTSKECQDFSFYYPSKNFGIAIVCDGHGSPKHFRSAKGSELATTVAIKATREFMRHQNSLPSRKDDVLQQLEKNIILKWNNSVSAHLNETSFTEDELNKLSKKDLELTQENAESAYGTTLILIVLAVNYCFGIQIGDGDCIAIDENGEMFNPVPNDDRLQFNITTSLCDKDAIRNFRHFWLDKSFAGILVSTDGVRNSFANEDYYRNFCITALEDISETPKKEAGIELTEFLKKLTENGSGDDVSVSVVFNKVVLGKALKSRLNNPVEDGNEKTIDNALLQI